MNLRRLFFVFITSLPFFAASTAVGQLSIIEKPADSAATNQRISQIRSLDNDLFQAATFVDDVAKNEIRYRLFKPAAKGTRKYPLVIFFHGSGAIGMNNTSQLGLMPKLFASTEIQKKHPAYLLAPQFSDRSTDYQPDATRGVLTSTPRSSLRSVLKLVDNLKQTLNIDEKRIYLVGFSMGGSTVMNALSLRPEMFAAAVSIAGIPEFNSIDKLAAIPIWLIHGVDDTENSIKSNERFYEEIDKKKIRFWKLEGLNHDDVFTSRILDDSVPKWLFKSRRK